MIPGKHEIIYFDVMVRPDELFLNEGAIIPAGCNTRCMHEPVLFSCSAYCKIYLIFVSLN
ncbi:MAG: hypothetical protein C4581_02025 [Nitrospiraceae bacterium]|nr:MAG: hypothetical protein C4581_02025 [Nitrospiraceae bacterium]